VSASGLRRLAGIYERSVGSLPRDERGRVWPEEAVEVLEEARAAVREQRAVSIEAALRGQEAPQGAAEASGRDEVPQGVGEPLRGDSEAVWAILEELGALRELVREQNKRISSLEEAVRSSRELPAGEDLDDAAEAPRTVQDGPERPEEGYDPEALDPDQEEARGRDERGVWRRILDWFGF
jgi:hypothetical protein